MSAWYQNKDVIKYEHYGSDGIYGAPWAAENRGWEPNEWEYEKKAGTPGKSE